MKKTYFLLVSLLIIFTACSKDKITPSVEEQILNDQLFIEYQQVGDELVVDFKSNEQNTKATLNYIQDYGISTVCQSAIKTQKSFDLIENLCKYNSLYVSMVNKYQGHENILFTLLSEEANQEVEQRDQDCTDIMRAVHAACLYWWDEKDGTIEEAMDTCYHDAVDAFNQCDGDD